MNLALELSMMGDELNKTSGKKASEKEEKEEEEEMSPDVIEFLEECKEHPLYPLLFKRPHSFSVRDMRMVIKYNEEKGLDDNTTQTSSEIRKIINSIYLADEKLLSEILGIECCKNCGHVTAKAKRWK